MSSLYSIAIGSMNAFQKAMSVTGHNISNVSTEGYSRQSIDFRSREGTNIGGATIGNGMEISTIRRISSELLVSDMQHANIEVGYWEMYNDRAGRIDSVLVSDGTNISQAMETFFAAAQNASSDPSSLAAREVLLSESNALVNRFGALDNFLNDENRAINNEISSLVGEVNTLTKNIAQLNLTIASGGAGNSDIRDQLDLNIQELSKLINIIPSKQNDGTKNILLGNGQSLVTGGISSELIATPSRKDVSSLDVAIKVGNGHFVVSETVTGGSLGGLLKVRENVLLPTKNALGRLSLGLAKQFNDQHTLGLDLNNNFGTRFFNDVNDAQAAINRVVPNSSNVGSLTANVTIDDLSKLTISDYELSIVSGNNYQLQRESDGVIVNSGSLSSFPTTISVDGFDLNITGASFNDGDRYLISPTRDASINLASNILNVTDIALASPIRTSASNDNSGNGLISAGVVTDISTADFAVQGQLSPPLQVEFLSSTSYRILNATNGSVIESGPITYTPDASNALFPTPGSYDPGYRVEISGAPMTGDKFNIEFNTDGHGDNRNALKLAEINNEKLFENNTASLNNTYGLLVTKVANDTRQSFISGEANQVLLTQSQDKLQSMAGVNLDEEAANLMLYQQAYQASARVIAVANEVMDVLFSTIGR